MATQAQAVKRSERIQQSMQIQESMSLKDLYNLLKRVIYRTLSTADEATMVMHQSAQVVGRANTQWATVALAQREDTTIKALQELDEIK